MKDIAPASKFAGMIAVSTIFGVVAAGVAWVMFGLGFFGGLLVGILGAGVTVIALTLGWRDPVPSTDENTQSAPAASASSAAPSSAAPVASPAPTEPAPAAAATPTPAATPAPVAEPAPVPAPEPVAETPAAATPATGGDADKPAVLSAARAEGADDLKQIKGVGPKLETTLNDMGIYHFDQIAAWGPKEQAWMDGNLAGFKGRATRDNWVAQAKTLAGASSTVS